MQFEMVDLLNPLVSFVWEKRGSYSEALYDVIQFKDKLILQDEQAHACIHMQFEMVDLLNPLVSFVWEKRGSYSEALYDVIQFKDKLILQDEQAHACIHMQFEMVDLLNPLVSFVWEKRGSYSEALYNVIQFKDKLILQDDHYLWESSCNFSHRNLLPSLPSRHPGLSTYHSQLVFVGGQLSDGCTNKVWVSDDGCSWNSTSLPPLPRAKAWPTVVNTGAPEYLLVAGGWPPSQVLVVEVLMEGQWWTLPSLPSPFYHGCQSIVHNGNLYIDNVHCDLQALLASCGNPNRAAPDNLWRKQEFGCDGVISLQGQLLYWFGSNLCLSYNDTLVAMGITLRDGLKYLFHDGKLVCLTLDGVYALQLLILAVIPPLSSVFI
jgi:hypothetical protein